MCICAIVFLFLIIFRMLFLAFILLLFDALHKPAHAQATLCLCVCANNHLKK